MAEDKTLEYGDTVRGMYEKMYPGWNPPEWAVNKLQDRFLKANPMVGNWNEVKAGQTYSFPTSSYPAQFGLRSQIKDKSRLTPEEYILVSTAMNRSRLGQESQVNSLRNLSKKTGKFKLPPSGVTPTLLKTIMDGGEADIENQIIHMAAQEDLPTTEDFNEWYEQWKFDPIYFNKASAAHKAGVTFKRGGESHDIAQRKDAEVQIIENISNKMMEDFFDGVMEGTTIDDWLNNNYGELGQLHYRIADRYRKLLTAERERMTGQRTEKKGKLEIKTKVAAEDKRNAEIMIEKSHRQATAQVVALVNGDLSRLTAAQRDNIMDRNDGVMPEAMSITEAMNVVFPQYNNLPYWDSSKVKEDIYAEVGTRADRKPDGKTTKQQDFQFYLDQMAASGSPVSVEDQPGIFRDYFLTQRRKELGFGQKQVTEAVNKQVAFGNVSNLIPRMMRQLHNKQVSIGVFGDVLKGWENVTDQFTQVIDSFDDGRDRRFLDPNRYEWSRADLATDLKTNIVQLAYSLARAADPNAKLSDFDIKVQLDRLTAGGQSKSAMMRALKEIHQVNILNMQTLYNVYGGGTDNTVPGFHMTWPQYLATHNTGMIKRSRSPDGQFEGFGYEKPMIQDDGTTKNEFFPIIEWRIGEASYE